MAPNPEMVELTKCKISPEYFIDQYCRIYDAVLGEWVPFDLWPDQRRVLQVFRQAQLVEVLKARQMGLTWLALAYCLWLMIFNPIATILLFSRRDDEAVYLLGDERLKGMFKRLPDWMQHGEHKMSNNHEWRIWNDSVARAFPTTGGDSYTATAVVVDEADLLPDLNALMRAVKPTIDAGGQLLLISRSDKSRPNSEFKRIFRGAQRHENGWEAIFLPWSSRPSRTPEWYEEQKAEIFSRTGSLDDLHEQYPATAEEALAPRSLDKRLAPGWLLQCFIEAPLEDHDGVLTLPGVELFDFAHNDTRYVIGADPAEGNPQSDDSSATVLSVPDGVQVCNLVGKFEPATFGSYLATLAEYYNNAPVLVERNNHGHAVIMWMGDNSGADLVSGWDGKLGWLTSRRGKSMLYADLADGLREGATGIRSFRTYDQLSSIDGGTMAAPEGMHDDMAMSYALAYQCLMLEGPLAEPFTLDMRW